MPRSKKSTNVKRGIGKPAVRKRTTKNPISMPDLPEMTALLHSRGTPCPPNKSATNAPSAPSEFAAAGPGCLPLVVEATAGQIAAPLNFEATAGPMSAPVTDGALEQPSSSPVTNIVLGPPIPNLTCNLEAAPMKPVMKKPGEAEEPKEKERYESKSIQQKGELETGENQVLRSPLRRLRKHPSRFEAREPEKKPKKKSIFEVVSRDTLQRYMVHYNIPKRQDLKKNLITRVQAHFDTIDHEDINLVELTNSVRVRLHQVKAEGPKKRKK